MTSFFATGEIVCRRRRLTFGRAGGGGREVGSKEVGEERGEAGGSQRRRPFTALEKVVAVTLEKFKNVDERKIKWKSF